MKILAIDPGTEESGWAMLWDGRLLASGIAANEAMLCQLRIAGYGDTDTLAIERFEARGMPVGNESVETMLWTGRFIQAWRSPASVILIKRSAVKSNLCGTQKAKDSNVRQAVIDRLGPPGKKSKPGPTYGVTSHAWQALAVALTASDLLAGGVA